MTTYRFEVVGYPITKPTACSVCGKKMRRSTTFTQTINPFNKNADGVMKTRGEIWKELAAEAESWTPVAVHPKCRDQVTGGTRG
jgi:hypothetical protein